MSSPAVCYTLASAPFEAACRIPTLPATHPASRLHGHSYAARVRARLPADWAGFAGAGLGTLRERLGAAVAPLDYAYLNDHLPVPTDENLARWLRKALAGAGVPGLESLGIRSTPDAGVDLDADGRAHVWRRFRFEAAHWLPKVPPGHPCGRLHGHGFEVVLHANQDLGSADMGIDQDGLAVLWAPLGAKLDHACLNDLPGLDCPTSEVLARWIWQRLKPRQPELSWVTVFETVTAGCQYDGEHFRIWKEQRFEAATRLSHAPAEDRRAGLHGHSYAIRLHVDAPLDEVLGWTVDFGDVKARFAPVYDRLDHHRLDALPGLADGDTAALAAWIRAEAAGALPELDRIDLYETPGNGVALCWGALAPALPG